MIVTERYEFSGKVFVRTYSNSGRYVVRDGIEYEEARDPAEFQRQYIEGDLIPENDLTISSKAEAYDILMGVIE